MTLVTLVPKDGTDGDYRTRGDRELVGGVAVLVTLVYLAVQVRQGRGLAQARRRVLETAPCS